jgi:hypothetical protein
MDFSDSVAFVPGTTCYATGWSLDEFDYQKWVKGKQKTSRQADKRTQICQTVRTQPSRHVDFFNISIDLSKILIWPFDRA